MKKKIIKRLKKTRNNWNIENKFHENISLERLSKFLNHYELLKKTEKIRGTIIEFGVLKASSLIRF